MSDRHRWLRILLPARAFEALRTGTKEWLRECSDCGMKSDLWEAGGIRFKAAGEPVHLAPCSCCGKGTMHRVRKKREGERALFG